MTLGKRKPAQRRNRSEVRRRVGDKEAEWRGGLQRVSCAGCVMMDPGQYAFAQTQPQE
jgi:hypothetical protein